MKTAKRKKRMNKYEAKISFIMVHEKLSIKQLKENARDFILELIKDGEVKYIEIKKIA